MQKSRISRSTGRRNVAGCDWQTRARDEGRAEQSLAPVQIDDGSKPSKYGSIFPAIYEVAACQARTISAGNTRPVARSFLNQVPGWCLILIG